MSERFQKIYTSMDLEDAHIVQALMRRFGIRCWLLRSNGVLKDDSVPLSEDGYKLFIPESQYPRALEVFRETLQSVGDPPFTGSLDQAFGRGRQQNLALTQLTYDPIGAEDFIWNPPPGGDLIGDAWKTGESPEDGEAPASPSPEALRTCDTCGNEIPAGSSVCIRCGKIN